MKKEDCIRIYGVAEWERRLEWNKQWKERNHKKVSGQKKQWYRQNWEKAIEDAENWNAQNRDRYLKNTQQWRTANKDRMQKTRNQWRVANPEKVKATNQETQRKGGKHYERNIQYRMVGLPHEKRLVRGKHNRYWTPYKQIIAPESQIHHEWIPETADYRGVALVEKEQHMHGYIDVIQILEGEITLLTEEEIEVGVGI